jgi:acetylornithine deacetylase/succinyl-diaminopimelate desuccinylase-like protein
MLFGACASTSRTYAPGLPRHTLARPAALLARGSDVTLASAASAQSVLTPHQALGRELLRELVETNTTYSAGSTTKAADALAARFRAAGFAAADVQIVGPDSGRDAKDRNLVVRFRGRDLRRPVLLINGVSRGGTPVALHVQAAEKVSQTYRFTVRNPGGHSARPVKDNAIYRLSAALGRLASYDFPVQTNAITRAYFARSAPLGDTMLTADLRAVSSSPLPDSAAAGRLARASTLFNALLRTTCVATMIEGGHAINALPQRVTATVNCRILPGVDPLEVERTLHAVVMDTAVVVTRSDTATASPPSVLPAQVERAIRDANASIRGPLPIIPTMSTGASDGLYLRNVGIPVYGVGGYFVDPTIAADTRAHGLDERIGVQAYYDQLEFTYRLLKAL